MRKWFLLAASMGIFVAAAGAQTPTGIRTYTTNSNFASNGSLFNLNYSPSDQLQVTYPARTFDFITVAASDRGTLVRINTLTGAVVGEYKSMPGATPSSANPSRTTVDLFGNVWAGNRGVDSALSTGGPNRGSIVKVGLIAGGTVIGNDVYPPWNYNTCVDRNGDGKITTSQALGDILDWPSGANNDGGVSLAQDECILMYVRTLARQVRHVSVDKNNDVWAGGFPGYATQLFELIDGNDGHSKGTIDTHTLGCGGYGGMVDRFGVLWSASLDYHNLLRYDTGSGTGSCMGAAGLQTYGMGIDNENYLWVATWLSDQILKYNSAGGIVSGYPKGADGSGNRGVAITPADDNVWVAHSNSNTVTRLSNSGAVIKTIAVGTTPTGVAVDSAGKVWVTNYASHNVMRIDPAAGTDGKGAVDLTVSLGNGAWPYNYSDMTGSVLLGSTSPQGTWTFTVDGSFAGKVWGALRWNTELAGFVPPGGDITVKARAANSPGGLTTQTFTTASNGGSLNLAGQYLEVQATLRSNPSNVSPILSDLEVMNKKCQINGDANIDIDDLNAITAVRNTTALPGDPRDADGDGRITVLDARVCALQCTKLNCVR